jgi:tetratricopeptide (TPR) repeat protein
VLLVMRQTDRAIALLEVTIKMRLQLEGEDNPKLAASYTNIGGAYHDKKDYEPAIAYFEKALRLSIKHKGEANLHTGILYDKLAVTYSYLGQHEKALSLCERAQDIIVAATGPNSAESATVYANMGSIYSRMKDELKAIEFYLKAKDAYEATHGPVHAETAISYYNLGNSYTRTGQTQLAADYLERALRIRLESFGEQHSDTQSALQSLAYVYRRLGKVQEAQDLFAKLTGVEAADLKNFELNQTVLTSTNLYQQKKYSEAIATLTPALPMCLSTQGPQQPQVAKIYNLLGLSHKALGDLDIAIDYYNKALSADLASVGEIHQNTATSHMNLGGAYHAKRDYARAKPHFEQALRVLQQCPGSEAQISAVKDWLKVMG